MLLPYRCHTGTLTAKAGAGDLLQRCHTSYQTISNTNKQIYVPPVGGLYLVSELVTSLTERQ
ncbi:MAG: hypothetical protein ACJ70Y_08890 [Nitrososphaera sp.]